MVVAIVRMKDENESYARKTGGHCAWEGKGTRLPKMAVDRRSLKWKSGSEEKWDFAGV